MVNHIPGKSSEHASSASGGSVTPESTNHASLDHPEVSRVGENGSSAAPPPPTTTTPPIAPEVVVVAMTSGNPAQPRQAHEIIKYRVDRQLLTKNSNFFREQIQQQQWIQESVTATTNDTGNASTRRMQISCRFVDSHRVFPHLLAYMLNPGDNYGKWPPAVHVYVIFMALQLEMPVLIHRAKQELLQIPFSQLLDHSILALDVLRCKEMVRPLTDALARRLPSLNAPCPEHDKLLARIPHDLLEFTLKSTELNLFELAPVRTFLDRYHTVAKQYGLQPAPSARSVLRLSRITEVLAGLQHHILLIREALHTRSYRFSSHLPPWKMIRDLQEEVHTGLKKMASENAAVVARKPDSLLAKELEKIRKAVLKHRQYAPQSTLQSQYQQQQQQGMFVTGDALLHAVNRPKGKLRAATPTKLSASGTSLASSSSASTFSGLFRVSASEPTTPSTQTVLQSFPSISMEIPKEEESSSSLGLHALLSPALQALGDSESISDAALSISRSHPNVGTEAMTEQRHTLSSEDPSPFARNLSSSNFMLRETKSASGLVHSLETSPVSTSSSLLTPSLHSTDPALSGSHGQEEEAQMMEETPRVSQRRGSITTQHGNTSLIPYVPPEIKVDGECDSCGSSCASSQYFVPTAGEGDAKVASEQGQAWGDQEKTPRVPRKSLEWKPRSTLTPTPNTATMTTTTTTTTNRKDGQTEPAAKKPIGRKARIIIT